MSQGELVSAFLAGRVSRRTLIRRLVAGGVSMGAAVSYAHLLDPDPAEAQSQGVAAAPDDLYPLITMRFDTPSLAWAVSNSRVRLEATCGEELTSVHFEVFLRRGPGLRVLGRRTVNNFLAAGGSRLFIVGVDTTTLSKLTSARLWCYARGQDAEGYGGFASATALLS